MFYAWRFGGDDPWALYHLGRPRRRPAEPLARRRIDWRDAMPGRTDPTVRGALPPYSLDDPPPCPHPRRMFYFRMAMAEASFDMEMRLHGVHPDQQEGNKRKGPRGTEMRMPGGSTGVKTIPGR